MEVAGFLGFLLGFASFGPLEDAVTGTALFRERMALPQDAVFEAVLADVSRADAPGEAIGRQRIEPAGNPPYAVRIPYDPSRIEARNRYTVRATIRVQGQLLFATDTAAPVLTQGAGKEVNLLLKRVPAETASPGGHEIEASFENTYWKLAELNGTAVVPVKGRSEAHLIFQAEGRLVGSDGCNRLFGSYTRDGEKIGFGRLGGTLMACPEAVRDREFVKALGKAARWRILGSRLELSDDEATLLARFVAARAP